MNNFGRKIVVTLASIVVGAPVLAQQTTAPTASPNTPAMTMTPGTTGAMPPSTTGTPPGTGGPMAPSMPMSAPSQRNSANTTSATPPSVTTSNANKKTAAAPVKGSNSFTMGEARRRIEAGGFTQVTGLKRDRDGVWRGNAMRDGASVPVYCDYQGNVGAS